MARKSIDWQKEREESVINRANQIALKPQTIIKPRTYNQKRLWDAILNNKMVVCNGPAGTGKTLLPCAIAANMIREGKIEKIIISRPLVTCGSEEVGILPGSLEEKTGAYIMHIKEMFKDFLPEKQIVSMATEGLIEFFPLAFMRGATLKNCFVLLDEAENATEVQLRMFTTRFGDNCTAVISGDLEQSDIPRTEGFSDLIYIMENMKPVDGAAMITLCEEDIMRSGITREMQNRWSTLKAKQNKKVRKASD